MLFSFYYTEKVAIFVSNKNPLKKEINENKKTYKVNYINAIISEDTIIPGLEGLEVDVNRSFTKMKKIGSFNPEHLIYEFILPQISIKNNLDKTIIKGNKAKNMVSIIMDNNENLINYSSKNKIKINAIYKEEVLSNVEYINGEIEKDKYLTVEKKLDKLKLNKNICLISYSPKYLCQEYLKLLVKESVILNSGSYALKKNEITSGSIILITKNYTLNEYKLLIKDILFKDLEINYLSLLISEKR